MSAEEWTLMVCRGLISESIEKLSNVPVDQVKWALRIRLREDESLAQEHAHFFRGRKNGPANCTVGAVVAGCGRTVTQSVAQLGRMPSTARSDEASLDPMISQVEES